MIILDHHSKVALYLQLYTYFRSAIEQNRLREGEKLPSIRGLAQNLSISKITVEKAYQQLLCEGYIESGNRSRYSVSRIEELTLPTVNPSVSLPCQAGSEGEPFIRYDFSSGEMDREGFDFGLWKRYVNKAFAMKDRLVRYGDPKGEIELRKEIVRYIQGSRGVTASAEQVVIGPGVQSLLNMLCSLLKDQHQRIAFEEPGFKNGRRIFADHSFHIVPVRMNKDGIDVQELTGSGAKVLYLSPSHQFPTGHIMPIGKRNSLLNWAEKNNALLIEDDYDSEFRYIGRPVPALKGLDKGGSVVYLGSFSKIIPPSIRLSFMVLPDWLLERVEQKSSLYNQAASTLEQLALARFMADGQLERQVRRLRKLYAEKSQAFYQAVTRLFGDRIRVNASESGLYSVLELASKDKARLLVEQALAKGCAVAAMEDYYWDKPQEESPRLLLYFSKIPAAEMETAVGLLREAWQ